MDQPKPSEGEHFTRPAGMTLLAAILGLLAVGYFLSFLRSLPADALLIDGLVKAFNGLVKAFNAEGFTHLMRLPLALCAGLASVGLWQMKPWALRAYALFAVVLVVIHVVKDSTLKLQGRIETEWWAMVLGWVFIAILLGLIGLGLRNTTKRLALGRHVEAPNG